MRFAVDRTKNTRMKYFVDILGSEIPVVYALPYPLFVDMSCNSQPQSSVCKVTDDGVYVWDSIHGPSSNMSLHHWAQTGLGATRSKHWTRSGAKQSASNFMKTVKIKCQLDATDDFYCRSYRLLSMFQAPLCPSSGAREYYTDGCCSPQTRHITLNSTPYRQLENQSTKYHRQ